MDSQPQNPVLPGIDFARGLAYTGGSRALYLRFLKRFPEDKSLEGLLLALSTGDLETAFACAHTLKGLAMQLGITALSQPAAVLCDLLRPRDPSVLPRATALASQLQALHEQVTHAIDAL